jgi:hypothetical protein
MRGAREAEAPPFDRAALDLARRYLHELALATPDSAGPLRARLEALGRSHPAEHAAARTGDARRRREEGSDVDG